MLCLIKLRMNFLLWDSKNINYHNINKMNIVIDNYLK